MVRLLLSSLFLFLSFLCFVSCDDKYSFTSSQDARLSFSTDTINFDTIITTISSSTRRIKVYNPNKEGIRISSVYLQSSTNSSFRVNVDGTYLEPEQGAVAFDFEILGNDSLFVFAEVTVPERNLDTPFEMTDKLVFQLESGVTQEICLRAIGQDAYINHGLVLNKDTTFFSARPIVIYDSLVVDNNVTLRIEPGTKLYFHDNSHMIVHGRLIAEGTKESQIVFRSDRTDYMFDYLPYDNTPSRWGGIRFTSNSIGNTLSYVDIHAASYGIKCDSSSLDNIKITIENSIIHNIGGEGLGLYCSKAKVANTQISNTLGNCVSILGGYSDFIHCTIGQFYPWDTTRGSALYLSDKWLSIDYPLYHAYFANCIITGYSDNVIERNFTDNDNIADYSFAYSLLRTSVSDDERFIQVKYESDNDSIQGADNFIKFDTDNYLYDFRIKENSKARNMGSPDLIDSYISDKDGNNRLSDEAPDAGCFEYIVEDKE